MDSSLVTTERTSHLAQLLGFAVAAEALQPAPQALALTQGLRRERRSLEVEARVARLSIKDCPQRGECVNCRRRVKELIDSILGEEHG